MGKMTKALRETILENVIKATTLGDEKASIQKRQSELARKLAVEAAPEGFYAMTKSKPKEWFGGTTQISAKSEDVPINNLLDTSGNDGQFWNYFHFEWIATPHSYRFSTTDIGPKFAKLSEEAQAWRNKYDQMKSEMMSLLLSCNTTEKLIVAMPELEKHVPVVERSYPVLVSTAKLTSTLSALGFDKTLAKAA